MATKISALPAVVAPVDASEMAVVDGGTTKKATIANLRRSFNGVIGSLGEILVNYAWPQTIIYSAGVYDHTEYTGPTGTWTETLHYDGSNRVDWVDIVAPAAGGTWRQSYTYTGDDLTGISAWVKQ
jgi:hypothetical protein